MVLGTASLGLFASLLSWGIQTLVTRETGATIPTRGHMDLVSVVYFFLVVTPLEQSLTALAVLPALRSKLWRSPYDTMRNATAASVGFSLVPTVLHVWGTPAKWALLVRVLASVTTHVVFASLWGYALGRSLRRRLSGTWFSRMFLVAVAAPLAAEGAAGAITTTTCPEATVSPGSSFWTAMTVPPAGAVTMVSIFIAPRINNTSPATTASPT